ncbi:hypothetical protein [Ralstonia solanacearum]|uniref:Aspartic protease n=1 Tax=Ralstonia solanacearum TaxID=305 RepID=D6BK26_RALSL|nr:hypothetical protein [Ralstonia solanacearum]ACH73258.1 aspartic protease [Ralstonia solanacearum]AMP38827.1 hypothetical protein LBM2029_15360 [Ralstonia solanacearum]AXV87655.1 hypothetical protein CJO78_15790 [Ralstonia solanacearum]AXW07120.1 hypothetical protein CJO82_15450 [Ralstonia solanacearum]AXW24900.1 hypothetical protein CJO86_15695 [Ralstonia solanacearum]
MKITKITGKKSFLFAVATAGMLIAGYASAQQSVELTGKNLTANCVRFYVNGNQDVKPGDTRLLGTVKSKQTFMGSIFKSRTCGGAAIQNFWYTTNTAAKQTWNPPYAAKN